MNILLVLIPMSLLLVIAAILAFAWALRRDQFEDMDTPALDVLVDEPPAVPARPPLPATRRAGDRHAD